MKSVTIKTEEGHEVRISEERGVCVLTCATSAGTVAHKLPAWVVQALISYSAAVEIDRDEYKLAADTWQADALRDGAALEKVRKLLGTTVVAERVPEVLEKRIGDLTSGALKERVYDGCLHTIDINGDAARCRRKAGHSSTHAFSLNEARALDAIVTHEDLRKLRNEILDELIVALGYVSVANLDHDCDHFQKKTP